MILVALCACKAGGDSDVPTPCAAGQARDEGGCVTVVTQSKVDEVARQAQRLAQLQQGIAAASALEAPVALVNKVRELDAWKLVTRLSSDFRGLDGDLSGLLQSLGQMQALADAVGIQRQQLEQVIDSLQSVLDGKSTSLPALRGQVSALVGPMMGELNRRVSAFKSSAIGPAVAQLEKIESAVEKVCSMKQLGLGADVTSSCDSAVSATRVAREFLLNFDGVSGDLLPSLSGGLLEQLDGVLSPDVQGALRKAAEVGR